MQDTVLFVEDEADMVNLLRYHLNKGERIGGKNMANPILVTGAAGRVGAVGRTVTELLLKQGKAVRAMVRNEDERAQALRDMGAEVVVGNLLDLDSMHRAIAGCETMVLRHVGFGCLSGRDGQCGGGGEASRREGIHQYVADDALTDEHYRNHREPAAQAALAGRAGAELVWSAGRARAAHSVSRRLLPDFHFGFDQKIEIRSDCRSARARLRRSQRKTLHVWSLLCSPIRRRTSERSIT